MKKRLTSILLALSAILLAGTIVLAATYRAPLTVTENASTSYTMLPIGVPSNNEWMADNGFMTASGLDTRVETLGGAVKPHLVTDNYTWFAIPVPADSQTNLFYTMGNSLLSVFRMVFGYGSNVTASASPDMRFGINTTFTYDGYIDTLAGAGKSLVVQEGAFQVSCNTTNDGTLDAVLEVEALDFVLANSDWVSIPDSPDLDFTDGAGNDEPATIIAWVNFDDATNGTVVAKYTAVGGQKNWLFYANPADGLETQLLQASTGKFIGRATAAGSLTPYEGTWVHLAMTYDASEVSGGINLYINGIDSDTADSESLPYTGMEDTTSVVELGSVNAGTATFLDGLEAELKIYTATLTPAQILADYQGTHLATNLELWYEFNDGAGNPTDSSGNSHDATANLADWDSYTVTASATGVAVGEHEVVVSANTTSLSIYIDGSLEDTTALGLSSFPVDSRDFTFLSNNVAPYTSNITLSQGGVEVVRYEPTSMILTTVLPDETGTSTGTINWGSNPAGVGATLGSIVAESQPEIGSAEEEIPSDVLPADVGQADFNIEPDVSGALLTNPIRPFVTLLSDTTTLTETQAWRYLGIVFVLFCTLATAKLTKGHGIITGVGGGASIALMVVMTVFPLGVLVFTVVFIVAGIIAQRSPSI